jgi:ArsR family transcriptional regulator, lead/cadmium/zinc/bismuth-responsive transcriptional repressor
MMRKGRATVTEVESMAVEKDGELCQIPGANQGRVALGKRELLDEETAFEVAEIFRALSDSSRAKIIYSLLKQELCTCDLAVIIGSSESSVSQHLRILRQLRIVKSRRSGKQVFYSLDDTHIRILLLVCLNHVRDNDDRRQDLGKILELFEKGLG